MHVFYLQRREAGCIKSAASFAVPGGIVDRDTGLDVEHENIEAERSVIFHGIRIDLNT